MGFSLRRWQASYTQSWTLGVPGKETQDSLGRCPIPPGLAGSRVLATPLVTWGGGGSMAGGTASGVQKTQVPRGPTRSGSWWAASEAPHFTKVETEAQARPRSSQEGPRKLERGVTRGKWLPSSIRPEQPCGPASLGWEGGWGLFLGSLTLFSSSPSSPGAGSFPPPSGSSPRATGFCQERPQPRGRAGKHTHA